MKPKPNTKTVADPAPREVLLEGTSADDGKPYPVTGDIATKRCPECDHKIDLRSEVCKHCGLNFETGEKARRVFQPIDRQWDAGWSFQQRRLAFIVLQVLNCVMFAASLTMGHEVGLTWFVFILISIGLQAFLLGTYESLNLKRNEKGKVTLLHTWRCAFIARPPVSVKWKEHESVAVICENEFSLIDWFFAIMLLGYGVVPGVLFWWFVIRADKFTVWLCKEHGSRETPIFRTSNPERAHEVQTTVSDVTNLPLRR
jgi:hypothetical protein